MSTLSFPCTQCGACCRNVDKAEATATLDRGDGACIHYEDTSRLCRIYHARPDVCRVDLQYQLHYRHLGWEPFCAANLAACALLQAESTAQPG